MLDKTILAVVIGSAIMHNGTYYDVGDEIQLTEQEFADMRLYVQVKDEHGEQANDTTTLAQQAYIEQENQRLLEQQELISLRHLVSEQQQTIDTQAMDYQQLQQRYDELQAENERLQAELDKLKTAKPSRKKEPVSDDSQQNPPIDEVNNSEQQDG